MKIINLNNDAITVDDEDFEYLSRLRWHKTLGGYVRHGKYDPSTGKTKMILMHRLLLNPPSNMQIDHINGNKLDNRKGNLRICTRSNNLANRPIFKNNKSGLKGVSWNNGSWRAQITFKDKVIHLGRSNDKFIAAKLYDRKAHELYGEFSKTNGLV